VYCSGPEMPFANQLQRDMHFRKHGHEFGAANEIQYEQFADAFMFGDMNDTTNECSRPNGRDRLRFDESNRHFGAACLRPIVLKTFYRVSYLKVMRRGGPLGFFTQECGRIDL
jgi:hypothetical protein